MTSPVYLERQGSGPPVLLLHGMPTPWDYLRPVAEAAVGAGHRVLLAAMPGYGPNSAATAHETVEAAAAAIEAAVQQCEAKSLSIVGFSSGAYQALHLAVRGRVRVKNAVLLGGYGELSPEERTALRGFAAALEHGASLAGVATARFLAPAFAASHPETCAHVESWIEATTTGNLARELRALAVAPSLFDRLASFSGRLVARTGELDLATPPAHAHELAKRARCGEAHIVKSRGHALLEEDLAGTIAATLAAISQ